MKRSIASPTLLAIVVLLVGRNARSQDDGAAFLKLASPGDQHKKLQSLTGNWDLTVKLPAGPAGKPSEVKGTIAYKSILGGRFIQEEAKTE